MNIAVLLSGGVDSSVALRLLQEQGHTLTAFYLKIWLQDEYSFLGECPWEEDLAFARAVCEQAGIPLEIISMQQEYWDTVVAYTIKEIQEGRTPNPDIFCNSLVKFGQFYDKISPDFDKVASGHYGRVLESAGVYRLFTSPDPVKDQTYFLAYLKQAQLARALFPIGAYTKPEIRRIAEGYNLPNMVRKDSQGICFLGKIKFRDFVKYHLGEKPGSLINIDTGERMGVHPGYYYFTIGQRSGIGLPGGPWYVVKKDVTENIIYISQIQEVLHQARNLFSVSRINWISQPPTDAQLFVKIRHGANRYGCTIRKDSEDAVTVTLMGEDKGIAAGQFAVFYTADECLGGGIIVQ